MKAKIKQMILMKRPNSEICDVIAKHLINKYNFKTIFGKKMNEIYVYQDGIFVESGKNIIEMECESILETASKTHIVNEIRNKVERLTSIKREDFEKDDKNLICINNGILNLSTRELMKHPPKHPKHIFTNKIPIDFVEDAHCTKILEFLSQVINEDDIFAIQEWFGFQLYREYFIKKAIICRGLKDTGKTTFMNLLIKFIGENNVSTKSLQSLVLGKWHTAKLYHKLANIGDDLSIDDVKNTGMFKQVTGRSSLDAEEKFGDSFSFKNYAKLNFACNKIPKVEGDADDDAFWDRWMIFDFDNTFDKRGKNTKIDILDTVTTPDEMSGLLNWALDGLDRLRKRGYFSDKRHWEENRKIMQGEASSVAKFNHECLEHEIDNWISNADLYDKYTEFCELNNITIIETDQKFAKDIRRYCNFGKFGAQKGTGITGVRNVKVKKVLPIFGI